MRAVRPPSTYTTPEGLTGIDKRPVERARAGAAPGPKGTGGSGLAGDEICDLRHHGGDDQAVYAYAREDLDGWEGELGRELPNGAFGENLTTAGLDVNGALIGERWRIGPLVLEVTSRPHPVPYLPGLWASRAGSGGSREAAAPGRVPAGDRAGRHPRR